jgi:hypothetical protein
MGATTYEEASIDVVVRLMEAVAETIKRITRESTALQKVFDCLSVVLDLTKEEKRRSKISCS